MKKRLMRGPLKIGAYMLKWLLLSALIGLFMGALSTFFLASLNAVTSFRSEHLWIVLLLPFSGAFFAFLYKRYGGNSIYGNNLVINKANGGEDNIPLRLVPLTLFGTIASHLFGASVGREGTAVQMGGAVTNEIGRIFRLNKVEREIVIICGISAGFSSVFGTPLAGTIFGLEVLVIGRIRSEALFPSFFSAFFANMVAIKLGISHAHYSMGIIPEWSAILFLKLFIAAMCFGIVGRLFSRSLVYVKKIYTNWISNPILRNFVGGCVIVVAAGLLRSQRYLGISLHLLEDAFAGTNYLFDFLGKLLFTVLSLGAGFQGGEVTPLFEIGATLGSSLALILHISVPFLAGLGFIGVFSGATNTPIACFIMGIELFGGEAALFFFMVSLISFMCSGNSGIYSAQKVEVEKGILFLPVWMNRKGRQDGLD